MSKLCVLASITRWLGHFCGNKTRLSFSSYPKCIWTCFPLSSQHTNDQDGQAPSRALSHAPFEAEPLSFLCHWKNWMVDCCMEMLLPYWEQRWNKSLGPQVFLDSSLIEPCTLWLALLLLAQIWEPLGLFKKSPKLVGIPHLPLCAKRHVLFSALLLLLLLLLSPWAGAEGSFKASPGMGQVGAVKAGEAMDRGFLPMVVPQGSRQGGRNQPPSILQLLLFPASM